MSTHDSLVDQAVSTDAPDPQANPPIFAADDPNVQFILAQIVARVLQHSKEWSIAPVVNIGRARDLTNLEETRIRYFEDLGALQPKKSTAQANASRLYTFADLRCLDALGLLVKEHGYRPAEAARFVKQHRDAIIGGIPGSLGDLAKREGSAITDGFLLARLMSQLIDAAQIELSQLLSNAQPIVSAGELLGDACDAIKVLGVILPMQPIMMDSTEPTAQMLHRYIRRMCYPPKNMLVALDRAAFFGEHIDPIPAAFTNSGRNDSTILFYSPNEPWELPYHPDHRYCIYIPQQHPKRVMVLIVTAPEQADVPVMLQSNRRAVIFDRILALCDDIFGKFRADTLAKNYRYRSDGFPIEPTQATYSELLKTITEQIFPDDLQGMAALLIPNSLDRPTSLAVLAHHNYDGGLAPRAKLDLSGAGQGLCGRAYNLREPFYTSNAKNDARVEYAVEEKSCVALAVPFTSSWGLAPFGVLYLASRDPEQTLSSDVAYLALLLANILSEQIGRWWLTRLRKSRDLRLHQNMEPIIRWFDGLELHGPDFERALDELQLVWQRTSTRRKGVESTNLALVLFDIDRYRQNVQVRGSDLVPLAAQMHVRSAIQKIIPNGRDYWFKNDHVLVLLDKTDLAQAISLARRIASQVRAVPPNILNAEGKHITLTVSAAINVLTYQDIRDLDPDGDAQFRAQMALILDTLVQQTAQSPANTIHVLTPTGWQQPG